MKQIILFLDAHSLKIILISVIILLISLFIAWSLSRKKTMTQSNLHRFLRQLLIASITTFILGVAGYIIANT